MDNDLHHLAAAYALDALEPAERQAFEAHHPTCAICRAEVVDHRATAARLAAAVDTPPPAGLRAAVLHEIAGTRQLSPRVPAPVVDLAARRRRRVAGGVLGAMAAAVVAGIIGLAAVRPTGDAGTDRELVALLAAPDVTIDALAATDAVGSDRTAGAVRVAWSAERAEVAVFGSGLDDPGDGRVYALWMLDSSGTPVASVLFRPGDDGVADGAGDLPGTPGGWGVTVEPEGGSVRPTGDILYLTT